MRPPSTVAAWLPHRSSQNRPAAGLPLRSHPRSRLPRGASRPGDLAVDRPELPPPLRHARSRSATGTHDGHRRNAYVLLPMATARAQPGDPARDLAARPRRRREDQHPPLGQSPYARATSPSSTPTVTGRRLPLHSWGYGGQIADLARMPDIVEAKLPWVHFDRRRLYAVGGSMGAQETLLLAGRYPQLLAGAVAVDGPADFALQYHNFPRLKCDKACLARGWGQIGLAKQRLARKEIGGTPATAPAKFAERSPITYARAIAKSCVPVQIWWSRTDKIVLDSGTAVRPDVQGASAPESDARRSTSTSATGITRTRCGTRPTCRRCSPASACCPRRSPSNCCPRSTPGSRRASAAQRAKRPGHQQTARLTLAGPFPS